MSAQKALQGSDMETSKLGAHLIFDCLRLVFLIFFCMTSLLNVFQLKLRHMEENDFLRSLIKNPDSHTN